MLLTKNTQSNYYIYKYHSQLQLYRRHSSSANLGLLNSISTPVILSAPKPSLVAKLLGQILSNIRPKMPLRLLAVVAVVVVCFLRGLFEGEKAPAFPPFFAGLTPVTLFLIPVVVVVVAEPVSLVEGDAPVLVYFLRTIFL